MSLYPHFIAQDTSQPIMCSYKIVKVFFEVWGFQGRVESGVHRVSVSTNDAVCEAYFVCVCVCACVHAWLCTFVCACVVVGKFLMQWWE